MSTLLPFIVAGISAGAVYGLAGVGLVLTYKTSGVFNFAHGALATVAAFIFYSLYIDEGVPWPIAAALCVLVLGPLMGLLLERLARSLTGASLALQVAGTVGLLLAVQASVILLYPQQKVRSIDPFLAHGSVSIGGTIVQWSDIITALVAIAATTALSLVFRYTRRGLAMRAVVDSSELLDLAGTSPTRTRRVAWMIGASLASASGVLLTPLLSLDPTVLTLLVVQAFGAAAIGRFTSLPLTFVGGLAVGILASLSTKWFTSGLLAGIPSAMPFIVLFAVLLVTPRRHLPTRPAAIVQRGAEWTTPLAVQLPAGLAVLVALFFVPSFAGTHLTDWTVALATTMVFLSLGLLVRTSGQISLCHIAFSAIGAVAFSHLTHGSGIPWVPALLLSALVAVPIGALLAIPAIRLSGIYLALATFGFGVLLQYMFYAQGFMFGDNGIGLPEPRPSALGFDSDAGFYRLVLLLVLVTVVGMIALDRGRLGRLLRGLAQSPVALRTNGLSVNVTRVLVFCLSAFIAAFAGALIAVANTTVSADSYPPLLSLTYFALVVIVIGRAPWYALAAALPLIVVPSYFPGSNTGNWLQLVFGVSAVALGLQGHVSEAPEWVRVPLDRLRRKPRQPQSGEVAAKTAEAAQPPMRVDALDLRSDEIVVRFGGHVALDRFSVSATAGKITGLIGPNGAGKTTTFDVLSGLRRPDSGAVYVGDAEVTRRSAAARARAGVGRTFQRMELFDSVSVRENVAIGFEGCLAGSQPWRHLFARRGEEAARAAATEHALALCDLTAVADVNAGALSTGQRRLVELARCVAGPYRMLLLDEPSSGLDVAETEHFGEILLRIVRERGVGILLVEHDMSLVLGICDEIFVLDFGELVFRGTPAETRISEVVRAAYLGDPEVEEAVDEQAVLLLSEEAGA
jgi:ABC-type branched-subunit amino acid transport system ATPase component/branched-subunit amino acid ABC-type transport system permease component